MKHILGTSELIKDFGTSKSAKIESLPSAFILSGGTAPSQTASTKTTYSSTQPDSCMPLRRDNIASARTCSRAFGTYAARSFQPRLPCLLDLAPLSMSRSGGYFNHTVSCISLATLWACFTFAAHVHSMFALATGRAFILCKPTVTTRAIQHFVYFIFVVIIIVSGVILVEIIPGIFENLLESQQFLFNSFYHLKLVGDYLSELSIIYHV